MRISLTLVVVSVLLIVFLMYFQKEEFKSPWDEKKKCHNGTVGCQCGKGIGYRCGKCSFCFDPVTF